MLKIFSKIYAFYLEILENAKKISWPEKNQTIHLSIVVIISVIILSLFSSSIDFFISKIIYFIIKLPLF